VKRQWRPARLYDASGKSICGCLCYHARNTWPRKDTKTHDSDGSARDARARDTGARGP
jgi:hypothetical protein